MNILHLGHVPIPDSHPQRHFVASQHPGCWVLNLALAQKAAGFDVEIIAQAHGATCDFDCEINGVLVHFLRTYHPYRHMTFFAIDQVRMAKLARQIGPDIVVAHGTEAAYGWSAMRSGIPYCILAQGLFFQIIPALGRKPNLNERFLRFGENIVWKRSHYAVGVSQYVSNELQEKYPHLDVCLIPLTYDPTIDVPVKPNRGHTIAYVGSFDERKGLIYLAEAMKTVNAQFSDVELHVAGNPATEFSAGYGGDCLRSLRKTLGDRLILHGTLSSKNVYSMLRKCTALVAPSLNEMFGCQLVEAIMSGSHGIVTDGTAMAENVRKFGNGTIVPQRNASAIANAILSVFVDPPSIQAMEVARRRIRNYMSPPVVAALHGRLYDRILRESSRGT